MFDALGQYKVLDRIGAGRMGELLRARDLRAGRTVAIRVVADGLIRDAETRGRLLARARAAMALSHHNSATLYEVIEDGDRLFFVFEYVPGETLRKAMHGQPLNTRHAIEHGTQLADALAAAHAEGLVHGHLTPDQIVITPKGHAKLLECGLTPLGGDPAGRLAAAAALAYIAPERRAGGAPDERSDVYALGAVLFEMVTGAAPAADVSQDAVVQQVRAFDAAAPNVVARALPLTLDRVIARMLTRDIQARPESAALLSAELRSILATLDTREQVGEPVTPQAVRRWQDAGFWVAVVVAAFVIVGALLFMTRGANGHEMSPPGRRAGQP